MHRDLDNPQEKVAGLKSQAYTSVLGEKSFRDHITQLIKKSLRDRQKSLAHFDCLDSTNSDGSHSSGNRIKNAGARRQKYRNAYLMQELFK